ncbi:LytTR family DNA-binding domain-containing protein [Hathewaya histolytica]|uniref:Stage 0 sporulation protein A homolog n=1 Tax=Hathewaya histolytica TaxID=1498 RepID=A0A4U9QV16_HATHI|nr:LytTR family DNA-binding domain-containing protein [Hathewaya histolytica]VTQ81858.1 sensory transduction protein lytT [Hathewaya histolytica]
MNCIIVDDEYPAREELKYFIENFSSIKIIGEFDDSIKALEYIENNKPHIVFLDINMPKLDGVTLSRVLSKKKDEIIIVFITAYKQYAVEAFEVDAFDYILKPFSEERILRTLNKLKRLENSKVINSRITLLKDNKMVVIDIEDICFCEARERETIVYTEEGEYISNSSISEFYKKLPKSHFFKSHRSYIVNIDKIVEIIPWFNSTYQVKVKNRDEVIPVSRNNINEFKAFMGI